MIKIYRFNLEPIQFPKSHLIGVRPCRNLIEVEYINPLDNEVIVCKGYYLAVTPK